MIKSLATSLTLTIIIELLVVFILGIRNKKDLLLVILVNTLTNPIVVYFVNISLILNVKHIYIIIVILEVLAFIIEGFILSKYLNTNNIRPYFLSFLINSISFSCGFILNMI